MSGGAAPRQRFGRFEVLLVERRLEVDGKPVSLGSRAFELLAALVERRDRIVPKDELIDVVWPGLVVEENNLQVQISALRKVLGAQAIATVPGRGYRFAVAPGGAGPAAADAPATRAVPRASASGAPASRLLVADDNKVNRLLLCRTLELMGHEVATADNGRSALEQLRRSRFDMLLLDLEMPELDGFGLLEARAADPALRDVPVIVTSSLEGVAHVARCIELGADDYLHKPLNPVLLKARVESSLERKHLRDRERERLARLAPGLDATSGDGAATGARRVAVTCLAARLRAFDALTDAASPDESLELLNSWTTLVIDAIEGRGGVVTGMAGDGISAVFGAVADGPVGVDAALACVQAALEMVELTAMFDAERAAVRGGRGLAPGIGIAGGEVVVGQVGTSRRTSFVCIGEPVRRARALEAAGEGAKRAVLMDPATRDSVSPRVASEAVGSAHAPTAT